MSVMQYFLKLLIVGFHCSDEVEEYYPQIGTVH